MSRLGFALTIAILFGAVVALSAFALQKLFDTGPRNEGSAEATEETTQATQATQTTQETTTAYAEETTAYKEETTALQGEGERTAPLRWTDNLAEHNVSIKRVPGTAGFVMLRFDGITYDYASGSSPPGDSLDDTDLGSKLAELNLEGNEQSASSPTPTSAIPNVVPVYAIKGYDTSFRLAARIDDGLIMFEVLSNPKANTASDVLDIGGKVSSISIAHWGGPVAGGRRVGGIEDPEKVQRALQELMDAPLKPTGTDYYGTKNPNHFSIYFELKDGGVVAQNYRMDTGRLSKILSSDRIKTPASGIMAPQAFREAIEEGAKSFLEEQEARKAEEQREKRTCADARTTEETRRVKLGTVFYTTNDVPGGPWAGVLRGTEEDDNLAGEDGEDEIHALGGNDEVLGGACDDKLYGWPGRDYMDAGRGDDVLYGGLGNDGSRIDPMTAGGGSDILFGGTGNDTLSPGKDGQRDEVYCRKGKDIVYVGSSADKIDYVDNSCEEKVRTTPVAP